jgi:glycosyltransferase involved in cell wall biosynthesis
MRATVVCTVLNEGESARRLLDSLLAQTRAPDEVIVVDGGSTDNTLAILKEYEGRLPLRVLVEQGANISRGRNVAIAAAGADVVACTDAGVWLEPQWLERLLVDFRPGRWMGAGFFIADPQTTFEVAMGATVLPLVDDVDPETFLPSSRSVAYTPETWKAAGGYPEWLDYCEDLVFDLKARESTGEFAWAPAALAHFRPRGTLRSFYRQYYRYARGDGKADLWRVRHAVRYGVYLVALPGLMALGILAGPLWLGAVAAGGLLYCRTPYRRLFPMLAPLAPAERARAVAWVPVIRLTGDIAKMLGYPAGWFWRIRHWGRPEIHWRR